MRSIMSVIMFEVLTLFYPSDTIYIFFFVHTHTHTYMVSEVYFEVNTFNIIIDFMFFIGVYAYIGCRMN